jgi:hypothetical protein
MTANSKNKPPRVRRGVAKLHKEATTTRNNLDPVKHRENLKVKPVKPVKPKKLGK